MANRAKRTMTVIRVKFDDRKNIWKYLIEIHETFMGRNRTIRSFPVWGTQLDRIKKRFATQYLVAHEDISDVSEGDDVKKAISNKP